MKNYRKIWQKHYGDIPVDENGKKYDIHHIDGNRSNNAIENLIAVSIKEHYDIHKNQGNWQACHVIMKRLNLTVEEQLEINKKISEIKKGRKVSEEHKRKIYETLIGRKNEPCSEETKQKIREKLTGRPLADETKAKLKLYTGSANNRFGIKHSEVTLEKMRKIKMGDNNPIRRNPEAKSKISKTILGSKWMYKDEIQSQIKSNDVESYIKNGWKLGRLKFKTK